MYFFNTVGFNQRCYNPADERECSDNGDCVNGICVCETGYSGSNLFLIKILFYYRFALSWGHEGHYWLEKLGTYWHV